MQNVIRLAAVAGHSNYLVAGMTGSRTPQLNGIDRDCCRFVRFSEGDLNFSIPGMSNVMPYPSSRFDSLTANQLTAYEKVFAKIIRKAAQEFSPDVLHSHHLWLASSVAREVLSDIPMVTSCHSTDLRQFEQCPHLRQKVKRHCLDINRVLALSLDQAEKIVEIHEIAPERIDIIGGG